MARSFGAIAQLGERVNGIHEVGSSILPGSTISQSDSAHTLSQVWRPPQSRSSLLTALYGKVLVVV
jgi:hypothetical protein